MKRVSEDQGLRSLPQPAPETEELFDRINDARRNPVPTQWDYLHLRYLLAGIRDAISSLDGHYDRVLDVFCGTRPYEPLFEQRCEYVALDVNNNFGVADVVSSEFLPFADAEFDVVLFTEGFYFLTDPAQGASELARVLRPGGLLIMTVPYAWEYERQIRERRFTEAELRDLFGEWDQLTVVENGGRAIAWATLTGRMLNLAEGGWARRKGRVPRLASLAFESGYLAVNALGMQIDRLERKNSHASARFPMNLLLTARVPGH